MLGNRTRGITAQNLLHVRAAREKHFPVGMFDEHAWNMLLHLFVALVDNQVMGEARLIELASATTSVGRRWLAFLHDREQIKDRDDGEDIILTENGIREMRRFLDDARIIHAHAANGSIYGT